MNLQVIKESGSLVIQGVEAEDEGGELSWEQTLRVSLVLTRSLSFTLSPGEPLVVWVTDMHLNASLHSDENVCNKVRQGQGNPGGLCTVVIASASFTFMT